MICRSNNPAARRYMRRFLWTMVAYVIALTGSVTVLVRLKPTGPLAWGLAVLPALAIVAMIAVFGLYLKEEQDEFQRTVAVEAILWATGATLVVTTVWGFLEDFAHASHLDSMWIYPIFCLVWGLSTPLVLRRYK